MICQPARGGEYSERDGDRPAWLPVDRAARQRLALGRVGRDPAIEAVKCAHLPAERNQNQANKHKIYECTTNQTTKQTTNQRNKRIYECTTNQSTNQPTNQPTNQTNKQTNKQTTKRRNESTPHANHCPRRIPLLCATSALGAARRSHSELVAEGGPKAAPLPRRWSGLAAGWGRPTGGATWAVRQCAQPAHRRRSSASMGPAAGSPLRGWRHEVSAGAVAWRNWIGEGTNPDWYRGCC